MHLGVVVGLALDALRGVALFMLAATSQLVLHTVFVDAFAGNDEERRQAQSLLPLHVVTIVAYIPIAPTLRALPPRRWDEKTPH